MGCGGACGIRIPPAGSFGPLRGYQGPGIPAAGSIGTLLGAGAISTDTRLGGSASSSGGALGGANLIDWQKHPIAIAAVLLLLLLFIRKVVA